MNCRWTRRLRTMGVLLAGVTAFFAANAQAIHWQPEFRFPGTFFPSFAISAAGKDASGPIDTAQVYGYFGSGSFGVAVRDAPVGSKLKVEIAVPEIGVSGEIEVPEPSNGQVRFIMPRLSWDQNRLIAIAQPISADVVFRLYVDGALTGEEHRPVRIRAINDVPLRSCLKPDHCTDYSPYMAAFVNENNPSIDGILRAALDIPAMPVKQWTGTQGTPTDVLRQVWAIWYLFQRHKVTYSSVTTVSDARTDLLSQTVRPMSQTLRTAQANCIDGTALFASILRKIGIEPVLVLVPGHAFLGFYTDAQQSRAVFLETTMLNDAENPFNRRAPTKMGTGLDQTPGGGLSHAAELEVFR